MPDRCDLAVIGAGYTGLSAAIAAHDCGAKVVVLEAGTPGEGASTRNGGMMGAHPRLGWNKLAQLHGKATADAIFAEANPALKWAKNFVAREEIACDLQQTGRIQLAWTQEHFDRQKKLARTLADKSDVHVELRERTALGQEIETQRYYGGLLFSDHCG
ncbi:MAG: FAD-binding oxidoreductase, partial [Pseudomonadota bacterium]